MITILHIEDDPLWGDFVSRLLGERTDCAYLGRAATGADGLAFIQAHRPSLVLLDLILPDIDGYAVLDHLHSLSPTPKTLLLTCRADDYTLYQIISETAQGLVMKARSFSSCLNEAISMVARGERYLCTAGREAMRRSRTNPDAFYKLLSAREVALVADFITGASDADIADCRHLSSNTVHSHRTRVLAKLGLHGTADLIRWAMQAGFRTSQRILARW